jgi:tetratricopeptide (TPR) repeat protein
MMVRRHLLSAFVLFFASSTSFSVAIAQETSACEAVLEGYAEVEELYRRGDYDGAASSLQAASVLCPNEALLLYNLARALERSAARLEEQHDAPAAQERRRRALDAYDAFLAADGVEATLLERARERRAELAASLERAASGSGHAAPLCRGSASPWPWIIVGLGAATVIGGAGAGVGALGAREAADRAPSMLLTVEREAHARELATVANTLLLSGGLVAIVGGTWGALDLASALAPRTCDPPVTIRGGLMEVRF